MFFGRCVKHNHHQHLGTTWCGRNYSDDERVFAHIDQAAYNELMNGSVPLCKECIAAIVSALQDPPESLTPVVADDATATHYGQTSTDNYIYSDEVTGAKPRHR